MKRRHVVQGAFAAALLARAGAQTGPRVIALVARRYRYEPS